ncbi:tRNA (N(6)-L-threonylcarbamoyladenosine(37)-C(2))-methylthiotransferase [Candidatus Woesearchaeota archaeon]|nr:tRNA (N(6)-L-threonylcarbamoyladenosine(37)-C(2))-methylthiotransferase [Candidatus Woesearchaeota archaeon]
MHRIFIKTYGCTFNFSDSEIMAGLLESSGKYKIAESVKEADLVIINSCTVKTKAETKFWRDVNRIKKPKILAGCVPQAERKKDRFNGYTVVGTSQINHIVDAVDETLSGNTVQFLKLEENQRLNLPKSRKNKIVEIVPINEGCLGKCDFCLTKFARGHLMSYKPEDIVTHIRNALNDGVKEIWLTSQDTACYGYDINTNIVALLRKILEIKRVFKIRLGMGNPDYLPDYLDDLIEVFKDPKMFKFIHIPLQSGSDKVIRAMKRNYTADSFLEIVKRFRAAYPDITLATDIICGHPDETDDEFNETVKVLEAAKPDVINISRFWARPGTIAAKKKQLPTEPIKERGILMTKLYHKIARERNKRWQNWTGRILIDEKGKDDSWVGRNFAYRPVIVHGDFKIGDEIDITVFETTVHDLRGRQEDIR